jgi:hypothetical protein
VRVWSDDEMAVVKGARLERRWPWQERRPRLEVVASAIDALIDAINRKRLAHAGRHVSEQDLLQLAMPAPPPRPSP